MGRPRSELHTILQTLISDDPQDKITVYFQPPEGVAMTYPCIVYKRDFADTKFASNSPYSYTKRYMVTVIDRNPDSVIPDKVSQLPMCVFNRFYTAKNLNHDVFQIFF